MITTIWILSTESSTYAEELKVYKHDISIKHSSWKCNWSYKSSKEWQQKHTNIKGIDATDILKFINSKCVDITDGMEWDRKDDNVKQTTVRDNSDVAMKKNKHQQNMTKLQIPVSKVIVAIKKYKLKAKEVLRRNKICSYKRRKLLDNEWVQRIKNVLHE